ncbi:MAG TPA: hypothetical protein VGC24_08685, partial [Burkholderiaceae bacterium]
VAPGSTDQQPCVVLVDRELREYGDDGAPVATRYVRITFQLSEVQPVRGGRVTLDQDGSSYVLDGDEDLDGSSSRWVVLRG